MDLFELPPLLWHTLRQKLKPSEELEVKRIIGWAEVEHNEELHQEASQLMDILHEYRERIDHQEEFSVQRRMQLARDPEWEFLQNEITTFVSALRKRGVEQPASQQLLCRVSVAAPVCQTRPFSACEQRPVTPASDLSASASSHKPAQVSRLDIRRPSSSCGRPSTASFSSRSGADTNRSSQAPAIEDDAFDAASSLNIETVESSASSLQLRLRREADNLMQNIAILHLALEDEADREDSVSSVSSLPSLEQLRVASSQLQAEFMSRSHPELIGSEPVARGRLRRNHPHPSTTAATSISQPTARSD
jgi:hypothetical protein